MAQTIYAYYRMKINSNNGANYCSVNSFEIRATKTGTNLLTGGTASASTTYPSSLPSGQAPSNAFDSNDDTTWISATGTVASDQWIQYEVASGFETPNWLHLVCKEEASSTSQASFPKSFTLQGSNDGSTWTALVTVNNLTVAGGVDSQYVTYGASSYTVDIPFGLGVKGVAFQSNGAPCARVIVLKWSDFSFIDEAAPDAGDGSFKVMVGDDCAVIYVGASGYQPMVDGPVTPGYL